MLASIPYALAMMALICAFALCTLYVGVFLVPLAFLALAGTCNWFRDLSAHGLGQRVEATYRPLTAAFGVPRTIECLRDGARWRDAGWGLVWAVGEALPILAAFGFVVGIVAWPVWVSVFHGSQLFGIGLAVACWATWAVMVVPLARGWMTLNARLLGDSEAELQRKLAAERAHRAEQLDHSAAEMERIERDLHDGAQARIAALGMTLGLAKELLERDPAAARQLLDEATATSGSALEDIRSVVRGMRPPVLADRGLAAAVRALAVDLPVPVEFESHLPDRLPAPVESALYFAVAELLANTVKHSECTRAWISLSHNESEVIAAAGDDGRGEARLETGGGLMGVARRVKAFDGTLEVDSPPGGPTRIRVVLPCVLSSPKTTHSFGTDSSGS
ncbi:sensor domain-containing protein [Calidifontibacter terrae]